MTELGELGWASRAPLHFAQSVSNSAFLLIPFLVTRLLYFKFPGQVVHSRDKIALLHHHSWSSSSFGHSGLRSPIRVRGLGSFLLLLRDVLGILEGKSFVVFDGLECLLVVGLDFLICCHGCERFCRFSESIQFLGYNCKS